jgi:hypothetical protein
MIKELTKLANHLDAKGLRKEADYLDGILRKIAEETEVKYYKVMQGSMIDQSDAFHGLYAASYNSKHYFYIKEKGWFDPCKNQNDLSCSELEYAKDNGKLVGLESKPADIPQFEMPASDIEHDDQSQAKPDPLYPEDDSALQKNIKRKILNLKDIFKGKEISP